MLEYQSHPCPHCWAHTLLYNSALADSRCETCGKWETPEDSVAEICADRMADLLATLAAATGADTPDAMLRDALGDLRHYADAHGLNFAEQDKAAHEVYMEEKAGS